MDKESHIWGKLTSEQAKNRAHRVGARPSVFITFSEFEPRFKNFSGRYEPFFAVEKTIETTARRIPDEDDKTQKLLTSEGK